MTKEEQLAELKEKRAELEKEFNILDKKIEALEKAVENSLIEKVAPLKNQYVKIDDMVMYVKSVAVQESYSCPYALLRGKGFDMYMGSLHFRYDKRFYPETKYEILTEEEFWNIVNKHMESMRDYFKKA